MRIWRIRIYFSDELALPLEEGQLIGIYKKCGSEVRKTLKQYKICCEESCCGVCPGKSIKYALGQRQQGEAPALVACEKALREVLEHNRIEVNEGQIIVVGDMNKPASA